YLRGAISDDEGLRDLECSRVRRDRRDDDRARRRASRATTANIIDLAFVASPETGAGGLEACSRQLARASDTAIDDVDWRGSERDRKALLHHLSQRREKIEVRRSVARGVRCCARRAASGSR